MNACTDGLCLLDKEGYLPLIIGLVTFFWSLINCIGMLLPLP